MSAELLIRIASLCLLLACAETLHGIARVMLLVPRVGKERAQKLSIVSGSLLAFAICGWWVPSLSLQTYPEHLLLGVGLALFMAGFDVAMGRVVMRKSWQKIWPDFNPASGNYLLFGLMALSVMPMLIHGLRAQG